MDRWRGAGARLGRALLRPDEPGARLCPTARSACAVAGRCTAKVVLVFVRLAGWSAALCGAVWASALKDAAHAVSGGLGGAGSVVGLHGAGDIVPRTAKRFEQKWIRVYIGPAGQSGHQGAAGT